MVTGAVGRRAAPSTRTSPHCTLTAGRFDADDGDCVTAADPANAAMPAARPATGRMTLRRNSSPCSRRASVRVQPSTSAMRCFDLVAVAAERAGERDDVGACAARADRRARCRADDARCRRSRRGRRSTSGPTGWRTSPIGDRAALDLRRHAERDVRGEVVAVALGQLRAHVRREPACRRARSARSLAGGRAGRGGGLLALQPAALAGGAEQRTEPFGRHGVVEQQGHDFTHGTSDAHPSSQVADPGL